MYQDYGDALPPSMLSSMNLSAILQSGGVPDQLSPTEKTTTIGEYTPTTTSTPGTLIEESPTRTISPQTIALLIVIAIAVYFITEA